MKKIIFRNTYKCKSCGRKIVGYVTKCPICKSEVIKTSNEKIITLIK